MTRAVVACRAGEPLSHAAQIMWEHDCGCVPVLDDESRVVGMITDRDACMAAYTRGLRLDQIRVGEAMSGGVHVCRPGDALEVAEQTMQSAQVRRLPVVDGAHRLVGLLSLNDLARVGHSPLGFCSDALAPAAVARTLAAVSEPRSPHGVDGARRAA